MNEQELKEWVSLKITNRTFEKTPEEKLALKIAKQKHKDHIKLSINSVR